MAGIKVFVSFCGKDKVLSGAFAALLSHAFDLADNEIRCTSVAACSHDRTRRNEALLEDLVEAKLVIYLVSPNWKKAKFFQRELARGVKSRLDRIIVFKCCGQDYEADHLPTAIADLDIRDANDSEAIRKALRDSKKLLDVSYIDDHVTSVLVSLVRDVSKERTLDYIINEGGRLRRDG